MVLTLIRATSKNNFELHVISICMPCSQCSLQTITTTTHNMYLRTICTCVTDYTFKFNTHRKCKELLEQNGFNVSQTLFLCLRNAFDITIGQTIKRYYRLQELELRFVLQME